MVHSQQVHAVKFRVALLGFIFYIEVCFLKTHFDKAKTIVFWFCEQIFYYLTLLIPSSFKLYYRRTF